MLCLNFVIDDVLLHQTGAEERNRETRAKDLLRIIGGQGPAIIKAGQALSSRPDLLPKEYLTELQKLQVAFISFLTVSLFLRDIKFPQSVAFYCCLVPTPCVLKEYSLFTVEICLFSTSI